MNLRDLKYLIAVADLQHFGKAAEKCFVSQPTLSMQIKKFEEQVGVQIFERTNKQVLITEAGKHIIERACIIVREWQGLREMANTIVDPLAGEFRLGIIPTIGPYLLPHLLKPVRKKLPKLKLKVYEDKTDHILKELAHGNLDAIILALPIAENNYFIKSLFLEDFWVALPANHPLSSHPFIKTNDLFQENLLLLDDGHCLRDQALSICRESHVTIDQDVKATSLETLWHMVALGSGITLLPNLMLTPDKLRSKQVVIKPFVKPKPQREIGIVWRRTSPRHVVIGHIAEIVKVIPRAVINCVF